jgi:hypothetical protein
MIDILGLGWLNEKCYGQGHSRTQVNYDNCVSSVRLGLENNLFIEPVKNFGRFEPVTQQLIIVTALALRDAGLSYGEGKLDIGLLAIHKAGCIASNRRFFQDYLDGGRKLSRANLFIYTLPNSPCAEAAIYFGLVGPLLYIDTLEDSMSTEIQVVENILKTHQAKGMLINLINEHYQAAIVVGLGTEANEPLALGFIPQNIEESIQRIKKTLELITK